MPLRRLLPSGVSIPLRLLAFCARRTQLTLINVEPHVSFNRLSNQRSSPNYIGRFNVRLVKPRLDGDALVYSSGPDFSLADADAWWLAFETVRMIDGELQEVDAVLENSRRSRFTARRVLGAESASAFSSFVRTEGWEPVDAKLKVSDVARNPAPRRSSSLRER